MKDDAKAKVESGVLQVERWVLAPLRHRTFFSLPDLNDAIAVQLEILNNRPFEKLDGTRKSLFETLDKPALKPLPLNRFTYAEWESIGLSELFPESLEILRKLFPNL